MKPESDAVMNHQPIYISKKSGKNLWQEYRIYPDRLELQSWFLLHTVVLPADEILDVHVRPPGFMWGIKLDNCNFCRHVSIWKKSGLFKTLAFSPDDPDKFVELCKAMFASGRNPAPISSPIQQN